MAVLAREYEDDADLRRMQELAADCWRLEGPFVDAHVGDLPWRMYQHVDKLSEVRVRLWLDDAGRAQAWAWLWQTRAELDFQLHPESRGLLLEVLEWFESAAEPREDELGEPQAPEGYELRTVRGDEDVERRVTVHRAAFAPSRVVADSYRRVMQAWPYRPELDQVAVAPDGSFAAFCLCWLDEENRAGNLEPVGTHPDHRRRGLARAVSLAGLRALHAAGAETALVYSVGGSHASRLYKSLGFASQSRHLAFCKRLRESSDDVRR